MHRRMTGFNGATSDRRWTATPTATFCQARASCFNGATSDRRWTACCVSTTDTSFLHASMGPPPIGGGQLDFPTSYHSLPGPASMGPPPIGGGQQAEQTQGVYKTENALQWGHLR